jgi:signal transduction histidine kinase
MSRGPSITRRLIVSVLLLEILAALGLITAITIHERHVQYKAFDANLLGVSNALFGAVQDAEDANDNVMLDLRGLNLPRDSVFCVSEEPGRILGSRGTVPQLSLIDGLVQEQRIGRRSYRFIVLKGERIIDPGKDGGIHHQVTVVYGRPDGHVWHEVLNAIRFFAFATALLLGFTTLLLVWLIRRLLSPIHNLASAAETISAHRWEFNVPEDSIQFVELRPLASAIQSTIARLQRSFEQQKRFTSDAAHELKTDLAIVKSSLQLLSMKIRTPEEYANGLALALDDFTRLEDTVQKMLTLARLEQPVETKGQICELDDVLADAIQQSKPFAVIRHVNIVVGNTHRMTVPLDRGDAHLLCSNIILNALQHSPEGAPIEIELSAADNYASFMVRDCGAGVREDDREYLFEPFYRSDESRSRKSGGTGLGLSICKAICDRIGGRIDISNHPSGGAVVHVIIPLLGNNLTLSGSLKV